MSNTFNGLSKDEILRTRRAEKSSLIKAIAVISKDIKALNTKVEALEKRLAEVEDGERTLLNGDIHGL